MDYLPKTSSEDVLRILKRDFNLADHQEVLRLLDKYGAVSGREGGEVTRPVVRRCQSVQ